MEIIEVGNQFYIHAESSLADARSLSLLYGDTFGVFDRSGDIQAIGLTKQGIFHQDTRYLSRLELRMGGKRPLLLSSSVQEDNVLLTADLTNPEMDLPSGECLERGTLHVRRTKFLDLGACFERIAVRNFGQQPVNMRITFSYAADFADIFEVRGQKRQRRGTCLPEEVERMGLSLAYQGLDHVLRRTRIVCSLPVSVASGVIEAELHLEPHQEITFSLDVRCESDGEQRPVVSHDEALERVYQQRRSSPLGEFHIYTSNEQFNDWFNRSNSDLQMMLARTPLGLYPYAGVPWFSTVFGRDGIITALQLLCPAPDIARGVLAYLAATQAKSRDPEREAEPGKVLHEVRHGEMARLHEVPFGHYYGSVDATPLFVVLAGAYYERTADLEFLRSIWPNIKAALHWIDSDGDKDGDCFVEYARQGKNGLSQQGWKDSEDSIFHADGSLAQGPIALCEVQSYVYAAKTGIATVAADLGEAEMAERLRTQAEELRSRFAASFWCEELSMYAMALDGDKRQCRVRSSNAGHCLFSGIAQTQHTKLLLHSLLTNGMYSGWGVRTIAAEETRYNPMSYHNGSVWPHDNALIAYGALNSREKELPMKILTGMLDLSLFLELHRLPELICGFPRHTGTGPTLYPVACSPQAWAAGACMLMLQSCLGLSINAKESCVYLRHTALPQALESVELRNLRVGNASLDLAFERRAGTVAFDILRRAGEVEVMALR